MSVNRHHNEQSKKSVFRLQNKRSAFLNRKKPSSFAPLFSQRLAETLTYDLCALAKAADDSNKYLRLHRLELLISDGEAAGSV